MLTDRERTLEDGAHSAGWCCSPSVHPYNQLSGTSRCPVLLSSRRKDVVCRYYHAVSKLARSGALVESAPILGRCSILFRSLLPSLPGRVRFRPQSTLMCRTSSGVPLTRQSCSLRSIRAAQGETSCCRLPSRCWHLNTDRSFDIRSTEWCSLSPSSCYNNDGGCFVRFITD